MKKLLPLLLAALVFAGCSSDKEITLNLDGEDKTGTYSGDLVDGVPDGNGKFTSKNSDGVEWTYTGEFKNGHFDGDGQIEWSNGAKEIGTYKDDVIVPEEGDQLNDLFSKTDDYIDHCIKMKAQCFVDPEKTDDNQYYVQAYPIIDNDIDRSDLLWLYVSGDDFTIKQDDYFEFTGKVFDTGNGTNAFGTELSAPEITVTDYKVLDYKDALSPTVYEVDPAQQQEQNRLEVTVDKVEISKKETRVYVTVKNGMSDTCMVNAYSAKIVQDGKQYDVQTNFEGDYAQLSTEVLPGATSSGVICFDPIEDKDFSFVLGTFSDNFEIGEQDFNFDIQVDQ